MSFMSDRGGGQFNLFAPSQMGPNSGAPLDIFNMEATAPFPKNTLPGNTVNLNAEQVQQFLDNATVSLGSHYFQTLVKILTPIFKVVSCLPEGQTHPVLRRVLETIDVSPEYLGMMQRSLTIFKTQAVRVGDHTRGVTFALSEAGKVMYSVAYGFSHMFVARSLQTVSGMSMMLFILAETIKVRGKPLTNPSDGEWKGFFCYGVSLDDSPIFFLQIVL